MGSGRVGAEASTRPTRTSTARAARPRRGTMDLPKLSCEITLSSHVKYFLKLLEVLPGPYGSLDTNRLTVAYFCVSGLDMLGALDRIPDRAALVRWVYAQQLVPSADSPEPADWAGGFRGAGFLGAPFAADGAPASSAFDTGHIAMTYTALAVLTILGDDLSRVHRAATLRHVRRLQQADGSFCAYEGGEADMRFVFCGAAICTMLRDGQPAAEAAAAAAAAADEAAADGTSAGEAASSWTGMDVGAASRYILASQSYDGAIGMRPGGESHGGTIYTALAALELMGTLPKLRRKPDLVAWCVGRQVGGFQGRPNKDEDTCYSFWIGASLALLGAGELTDLDALAVFAFNCEGSHGGIAKCVGNHPDVLHSHYALAGLSLRGWPGLLPLEPGLGITARACQAAGLRQAAARAAPEPIAACEPCDIE